MIWVLLPFFVVGRWTRRKILSSLTSCPPYPPTLLFHFSVIYKKWSPKGSKQFLTRILAGLINTVFRLHYTCFG